MSPLSPSARCCSSRPVREQAAARPRRPRRRPGPRAVRLAGPPPRGAQLRDLDQRAALRSGARRSVAYLYCRMLDAYEDLIPDAETSIAELSPLRRALRRRGRRRLAATVLPDELARDVRDRIYVLLISRCSYVDALYEQLPPRSLADPRAGAVDGGGDVVVARGLRAPGRRPDRRGPGIRLLPPRDGPPGHLRPQPRERPGAAGARPRGRVRGQRDGPAGQRDP